MQILLADAKSIKTTSNVSTHTTTPLFDSIAESIAQNIATIDIETIQELFKCSKTIASKTIEQYKLFNRISKTPAIFAYDGQAYKHLIAKTLSPDDIKFANEHLWITSFLYGLLRPSDGIAPYRIEHILRLPSTNDEPLNKFWRNKLTDIIIENTQKDDNILLHLSTSEYESLCNWKTIKQTLTVIQPVFYIESKGKLTMQAVWAKTCRGAMTRFILQNKASSPDILTHFDYCGFKFSPNHSSQTNPCFIKHQ